VSDRITFLGDGDLGFGTLSPILHHAMWQERKLAQLGRYGAQREEKKFIFFKGEEIYFIYNGVSTCVAANV
jgi:hypothetical protein